MASGVTEVTSTPIRAARPRPTRAGGKRLPPGLVFAAIVVARVGWGYQFQTVGSLGPLLIPLFRLDYTTFGKLIGAFLLVGTFAAIPLGLAGARFGDRLILAGGIALMIAGAVVSAIGGGPGGIALGRAISGTGAVGMVVIQGKLLADIFQGRTFLLAISASVAAYPIGVGLGQMTQPWLAERFGWPSAFLAGGAIQLVALGLFLGSYEVVPRPAHRRVLSLLSGRECLLAAIAGLVWATYTAGYTGFLSYAPSLLAQRGDSLATTSLVVALATWGSVPPTLFGAGLAGRYGTRRVLLLGTTALALGVAGTALTTWPIGCALLLGLIGNIQPGVIQAIGTLSARPHYRAAAMGIFYTIYYLAGSIVPAICGYAADLAGGPGGALLCAAAVTLGGIPAYLLHRRLSTQGAILASS
jgi:MFS family permease